MASDDHSIGVKMSNIGWDVKSAGDANLYFSSSWPMLKIEATDTASQGSTVKHSLNYPPLAFAWNPVDGLSVCAVDSGVVYLPQLGSTPYRYFIFRQPVNVAYQSPVVKGPLQNPTLADNDFGMRFVKDGKELSSKDLRDFTLHSSARSPLLHAVITGNLGALGAGDFAGITGLKWVPDLPYRPVYFVFYSADGTTWNPVSTVSAIPPRVNFDTLDKGIVLNAAGLTGQGSIILLKDPLDLLPRTSVTL